MPATFDTRHIAPGERFEYWREVITERFLPLRPERCGDLPFDASLELSHVADLPLTTIRVQAQCVAQPAVSAPDEGFVFLNLQVAGRMQYAQAGAQESFAGDGFLIDSSLPFELRCPTDMTHLCLTIPKAELAARLHAGMPVAGAQLSHRRGADLLCLDFLSALAPGAVAREDDDVAARTYVLDLLAFALNRRSGAAALPREAAGAAVHVRALRIIDNESNDPALNVAALASRLGLSPRSLQRLFRRYRSTPGKALAAARIATARRRLEDPSCRHLGVTDIGLGAGFNDAAYFSRCFNRATGMSPRRYRRLFG